VKLLLWGLGYVGTVTAACLARSGHEVVGVEPSAVKVAALMAGRSPIKEPKLEAIIEDTVARGALRAVTDPDGLVAWADASLICVGTPSTPDGDVQLNALQSVAREIGRQLAEGAGYHVAVVRSTVFPGTTAGPIRETLESVSGLTVSTDFGLAMNPEFLRETTAVDDFYAPPFTVIGADDDRVRKVLEELYAGVDAPVWHVSLEQAELVKLVCNAFHALKVGFANEVGRVCDALGVDSRTVMELVCADTKLNISPAYLRPGFAFGGSCLPKDLRSLTVGSRRLGVELPILDAILPSNRLQVDVARAKVHRLGARKVAVLGLSFKPYSDDVRESPAIEFVRALWQDGLEVVVHDPDIRLDEMLGSNQEYLERQLPQIHAIARATLAEALEGADVVVVSQRRPEFVEAVQHLNGVAVLDLTDLGRAVTHDGRARFQGMSW
jgi:GDP-mannose 6-dehydrogenase